MGMSVCSLDMHWGRLFNSLHAITCMTGDVCMQKETKNDSGLDSVYIYQELQQPTAQDVRDMDELAGAALPCFLTACSVFALSLMLTTDVAPVDLFCTEQLQHLPARCLFCRQLGAALKTSAAQVAPLKAACKIPFVLLRCAGVRLR